jgi:hypothetical protein
VIKYNKNHVRVEGSSNYEAFMLVVQFLDGNLITLFEKAEEKKWYGELTHFDEKGMPVIIFNFTNGVCTRCCPIEWAGPRNVFKASKIFNKA